MAPTEEEPVSAEQPASAAAAGEAAPAPCDFDTSGVAVAGCPGLGGLSAVAARSFKAGARVFRERALVVAAAPTNLARLRAYLALDAGRRREVREGFFGEAPAVRCAATAACRADAVGTGDSAAEVLATLRAEGCDELDLGEVESVIRVWNLNAYDSALAHVACKVAHSCEPNVTVRVDVEAGAIEATACRAIEEGEPLGSWYFQDTGLWWMGADVRRAIFETDRGFLCACRRCQSPDPCRAMPCDACGKGNCTPLGFAPATGGSSPSGPPHWRCGACGRSSSGDALRLAAEAEVVPRVLLELRPPRARDPRAAALCGPEELTALAASARERLGPDHWATAAMLLVLHYRARPAGGRLDALTVAAGCRFLGWLMGRGLPQPPASVVRTPVAVALDCALFLSGAGATAAAADGAGAQAALACDRRSLAARLLTDFLFPIFDASGATIAGVANTGARVAQLRAWLAQLRASCGRCGTDVGSTAAAACGRCKQVRYCSRACQQADWKDRHKEGCLPIGEPLSGEVAWQMLAASR